jgi:aldose 1-epimerase
MELFTNQPGLQVYTGNFLDGTVTGKRGVVYPFRASICLEPQNYPDSPNKKDFPSPYLKPGEKYTHHSAFRFSIR